MNQLRAYLKLILTVIFVVGCGSTNSNPDEGMSVFKLEKSLMGFQVKKKADSSQDASRSFLGRSVVSDDPAEGPSDFKVTGGKVTCANAKEYDAQPGDDSASLKVRLPSGCSDPKVSAVDLENPEGETINVVETDTQVITDSAGRKYSFYPSTSTIIITVKSYSTATVDIARNMQNLPININTIGACKNSAASYDADTDFITIETDLPDAAGAPTYAWAGADPGVTIDDGTVGNRMTLYAGDGWIALEDGSYQLDIKVPGNDGSDMCTLEVTVTLTTN